MPVYLIDTIKPKNGGGFAIADAADIAVTSDKRLPEALGEKANASDVAAATAELQGEIDQIVISSAAETVVAPEVAQARTSSDGEEHNTLKERIDYDNAKTNSRIGHISTKSRNLAEVKKDYLASGITVTYNNDSSITVNGTPSSTAFVCFNDLPAGTYTATWNDEVASLSGCSLRYGNDYSSGSTTRWLNSSNKKVTITIEDQKKVMLALNTGTTFNNATFRIQIESGSDVGEYIQAGDIANDIIARAQIDELGDVTSTLSDTTANIESDLDTLDKNTSGTYQKTDNLAEVIGDYLETGVTVTYNDDGSITVDGTPSNTSIIKFKDLPAGTYTAAWNEEVSEISGFSLRYGDEYSIEATRWLNNAYSKETVTLSETSKVMLVLNKDTVFDNMTFKILIESGSDVGDFVKAGNTAIDSIARSQATAFNKLGIYNQTPNLAAVVGDYLEAGVSVTYNGDGSITIDGTPSNTSFVYFASLPAGTYTAAWNEEVAGADGYTLRYGSEYSTSGSSRWLNVSNSKVTITVAEETKVMLALNKNTVFDNAVFKIEIESGSDAGEFVKPGNTALDVVARTQAETIAGNVEELSAAIENIGDLMSRDKSTWSPLLNAAKNAMIEMSTQSRKLNFAVITDTHVFPEADNFVCLDNIQLFAEATQYCDFAVHCGDVAESGDMTNTGLTSSTTVSKEDRLKNWMAFLEQVKTVKCPLYICRGNHDVQYKVGVGDPITNPEFDSLVRQQAKDVVRDEEQPFKNYYYKDFSEFKVRVIVLNQYDEIIGTTGNSPQKNYGSQQMKWLAEIALNFTGKTTPSAWHTVIFAHGTTYDVDGLRGILYAYCRGNSYSSETATMDFSVQGAGNLVAVIHGDSHQDEYNTETESSIKYNCIGIDQSFVKSWAGTSTGETDDTAELTGSKKYCVDLFTLDTANHTLYETRIGRGKSRVYTYGDIDTQGANSRTIIT